MADPVSREPGEETPADAAAARAPTEPLTLTDPEPVEPARTTQVEEAEIASADSTKALPDEAEIMAEMPPADPEPAREAVVPPAPTRAEPPRRRSAGGFFALLLGGVIAAGAGFALSRLVPEGWPLDTAANDAVEAQSQEIAALRDQVASLAAAPSEDLSAQLAEAVSRAEAAESAVSALEQRLTDLEEMPAGEGGVSTGELRSFQEELAALRSQVEQGGGGSGAVTDIQAAAEAAEARLAEAEQQAATLKSEVEATARAATTSASLSRVRAALDSGSAYTAPLDDLAAAGLEIPASLIAGAEGGIPTLAALTESFPEAARAGLDESLRASMGDSFTGRMSAFLRTQSGVRSLTPREGDDPDAVLSRAEAAVRGGDLQQALTEIQSLPAEGQEAMAGWVAEAQKRIEATDAVAALAASAEAK